MQQQPGQVQYVMINNQLVPVQVLNQGQFIPQQPMMPPSSGYQQPAFVPMSAVNTTQPPLIEVAKQPQQPLDEYQIQYSRYTKNVLCYTITYLIFFIGCIGVQFGLYGSLQAANLWISSYVFLIVVLILFFIPKKLEQKYWVFLLGGQGFLLFVSFVLEIAAFAMAVSHPVLFNYESKVDRTYALYNDRRILYSYSYNDCYYYYSYYSYSDYEYYYGSYCDSVLGFSSSSSSSSSSSDYSDCEYLYQYYSNDYDYYEQTFGAYCDPILGLDSSSSSGSTTISFANQDKGNLCKGYYNFSKDYCYPLQYGMMAYAVINFIFYLMLFYGLSRRIYSLFKHTRQQKQIQPQIQQEPVQFIIPQ